MQIRRGAGSGPQRMWIMASIGRWVLVVGLGAACGLFGIGSSSRDSWARGHAPDDWQYDLIHLRNGKVHQGLLVQETPNVVKFWRVQRSPGHPTRRVFWTY